MEPSETTTLFDILNREDNFIVDNFKNIYPVFRDCFSGSTDTATCIRALKIVFGPGLKLFDLKDLDEEMLKYACPCARKIFFETLNGHESARRNKDRTNDRICKQFSDSLCLCQVIVSQLVNAFVYIETVSTVKLNEVKSLLIASSDVLHTSYEHCANSEEFYGSHLNVVSDSLVSFFRTAQELQGHIIKLLQRIQVEFENDEISTLNIILTFTYKSGIALMNLDVKTMADLWKAYTCFTEKYSEHLKTFHEVSAPVHSLTVYIVNYLENFLMLDKKNSQQYVKTSKIMCFLLKVVIKFAENFSGYLGKCHEILIKLLTVLQKISHPYVEILKLTNNINAEHLNQLIIGMDPLLSILITDSEFVHNYGVTVKKIETNEKFAVLLLCNQIVRKLILSDSITRQSWFNEDTNIIVWIFDIINSCNYELCLDVKFPGVVPPGCQETMIGYFEYLYINLSAFLIKSVTKELKFVESILAKYMLQKNPWCSLLAADIWCVLLRCCETDVCRKHLNYMCHILLQISNCSTSPEKLYMEWITSRLFSLITQKQANIFLNSYPPKSYPHLWNLCGDQYLRGDVLESVKSSLKDLKISVTNFFLSNEDFCNSDYERMESALMCRYKNWMSENKDLEEVLILLWKFDPESLTLNPIKDRYINLILTSSSCILPSMSSGNVHLLLSQLKRIYPNLSDGCKILCLNNLCLLRKSSFHKSYEKDICLIISFLFHKCLTNSNVFVRMRSLDVFSEFASLTGYTEIITLSVNSDNALQKIITSYLQKKHVSDEDFERLSTCMKKMKFVTYVHQCKTGKRLHHSESDAEPPTKKVNLVHINGENVEAKIDKIISRLKCESNEISRHANILTPPQKEELSDVIKLLLRTVHKQW